VLEIRSRLEAKGGREVGRKRRTPEQIIVKLREAEIELAKGLTVEGPRDRRVSWPWLWYASDLTGALGSVLELGEKNEAR
jgi:hypothetical protein